MPPSFVLPPFTSHPWALLGCPAAPLPCMLCPPCSHRHFSSSSLAKPWRRPPLCPPLLALVCASKVTLPCTELTLQSGAVTARTYVFLPPTAPDTLLQSQSVRTLTSQKTTGQLRHDNSLYVHQLEPQITYEFILLTKCSQKKHICTDMRKSPIKEEHGCTGPDWFSSPKAPKVCGTEGKGRGRERY